MCVCVVFDLNACRRVVIDLNVCVCGCAMIDLNACGRVECF